MNSSTRYYNAICKIFPRLSNYQEVPDTGRIYFTVEVAMATCFHFAVIRELATALKTDHIDMWVGARSRELGSHMDFECSNVEFPEMPRTTQDKVVPYSRVSEF
jgi:hypothetical protein